MAVFILNSFDKHFIYPVFPVAYLHFHIVPLETEQKG